MSANGLNTRLALQELSTYLDMTRPEATYDAVDVSDQGAVVELILDRLTPEWRSGLPSTSRTGPSGSVSVEAMRELASRARALLWRPEQLEEMLGDDTPDLHASEMHPWVWEGARAMWQTKHYGEAVLAAAKKLNAETQNKVGIRKPTEGPLFELIFSVGEPTSSAPRLRLCPDDGSETYKSRHNGAGQFAKGLYMAVRNPLTHDDSYEISESEALEFLAAFSMLARWVDAASIHRFIPPPPRPPPLQASTKGLWPNRSF